MSTSTALKDYFGRELAILLSDRIKPLAPEFHSEVFIEAVSRKTATLELKGRVAVIAEELQQALPFGYPDSLEILLGIIGPENETEKGMFTEGYFLMPIAYFVERYGLDHFEISMNALYEITKRHTSEYAIRPFLLHYEDLCLEILKDWLSDDNSHVRRLVSEGTRPRLPWAKRIPVIKGDPAHNLALLEPLLQDSSGYVRKSVANHLHDLNKDYRDTVLPWLLEHLESCGMYGPWILQHSLRSMAKSGDQEVLKLLTSMRIASE
ncbi:DNA alkylation repair protein [Paenibacillus lautus]|uniref:DNA alkylation repair protein n=2 Tax=Paenibacillus lautus TaxID=1401 RepID=UPI001C7CEE13|nr:DNA alkylation repair protein [Paenibacillus lautus]MBX4149403.1 DNA alkylation repair protein [Paenibacillus lautus]